MLLLSGLLYLGIQQLTRNYVISRMQHDTDSIIAGLSLDPKGIWYLAQDRMPTIYQRVQSGHYYLISVGEQMIRSRSLFDTQISLPTANPTGYYCYTSNNQHKETWLACLQQVKKKDTRITIWVAEDISSLEATRNQFLLFAVAIIILTVIFLLITQYYILKRGFLQLDKVRKSIKNIHDGTSDNNLQNSPIEILPLVKEIDRLLTQLSRRVQRTRNALGNLAHELKRPLQRYRLQTKSLNSQQRKEAESILNEIQGIVDRELKRARIVGVATPGRYINIDEDLSHLIKVMQSIYSNIQIEAHYADNLVLPYDRDDILEILGNLLDNACKFARSKVSISLAPIKNGWRIRIEDDGEGVSQDSLQYISERGLRLDESIHGHGLGLSICKDIVESYSGVISFGQSELKGLAVEVDLPNLDL